MKRKSLQRVVAMSLTGVMILGTLAGCSGQGQESATTPSAAEDEVQIDEESSTGTGEYADYSNGFDQNVTIKIPVYDRAFEGWNVTDNTYTRWVQEEFGDKYNINVEYVAIGRNTEVTDYMQMISAGTAPSIIMHYDMPQAVNYYLESAMQIIDLKEIEHYAPTYYESLGDTINTYGEMDDEMYFFFANRPTYYYNWVTLVRKDWLDQVGAKMPNTLEELNEVALQWKDAGLGTLEEPLYSKSKSFTYYYNFIGNSVDEKELALYSDLNVSPLTWAPAKEWLKNLNYSYNNGIIDLEFYLKDEESKAKADFVSGKTGTHSFYIAAGSDAISSLMANDENAEIAVLPLTARAPEGNNAYYYEYPPYGMIMGINSKATDEERAAVWMYLEWLSQPENLFKLQNGIEGETYTLDEDGLAVPIEDYSGEWRRSENNNKDYWCLVVEAAVYDNDELTYQSRLRDLAPAGYEYLIEDSKKYYDAETENGLLNTAYTKTIESLGEYAADLTELWKELYVKCVTCAEADFESTYQEACETYLAAGYQEILDEKEALYDEGAVK